jgi:hypothetical protein
MGREAESRPMAIASFHQPLERKPDDTFAVIYISNSWRRMEKPDEFDIRTKGCKNTLLR